MSQASVKIHANQSCLPANGTTRNQRSHIKLNEIYSTILKLQVFRRRAESGGVKHDQGNELSAWSPARLAITPGVIFAQVRAASAGGCEAACLSRDRERCLAKAGSVQKGERGGGRECR